MKQHVPKTKYKIVLLGDQGVGKTAIINRFINSSFTPTYDATIGIDFLVKNVVYDEKAYRLQLWDTAGQERFKSLIPSYLKDSSCSLICYDASNLESLKNAKEWLQLYNQYKNQRAASFLVGNKIDLEQAQFKQKYSDRTANRASSVEKIDKLTHFRVSAKQGTGIEELFKGVTHELDHAVSFMKLSVHTSTFTDHPERQEEIPSAKPLRYQTEPKNTRVILKEQGEDALQPIPDVKPPNGRRCCF